MTLIPDKKCDNCPGNILNTLVPEENKWISKHSFLSPSVGKDCILRLESGEDILILMVNGGNLMDMRNGLMEWEHPILKFKMIQ